MKISNDTIGNRICNLTALTIVPQSTAQPPNPPSAPSHNGIMAFYLCKGWQSTCYNINTKHYLGMLSDLHFIHKISQLTYIRDLLLVGFALFPDIFLVLSFFLYLIRKWKPVVQRIDWLWNNVTISWICKWNLGMYIGPAKHISTSTIVTLVCLFHLQHEIVFWIVVHERNYVAYN